MNKFIQNQSKEILKNLGFETNIPTYQGLEKCLLIHLQTEVVIKKISCTKEVLDGFNPHWKTIRSSMFELTHEVSLYLDSPFTSHFSSDIQRVITKEKENIRVEINKIQEILLNGKSNMDSKEKLSWTLTSINFFANAIKSTIESKEENEILKIIELYQ